MASVRSEPPQLPEKVRRRALALGEPGRAWIAGLGDLVAAIAANWQLSIGAAVGRGSESFVIHARTAEGRDVVLKLAIPGLDPTAGELRTLTIADGRGYVCLLRRDRERNAMLLERLGPQLADLGLPIERQIEAICATLREAWRPPPPGERFTTGAQKARCLATAIQAAWRELGAPCAARTVETACTFAALRAQAFDPAEAVLAHGDAHAWNTLVAPGGSGRFKFVDPDGLVAERAYDLAISMREWPADFLAGDPVVRGHERCLKLAALAGVDPQAIWQWGLLETAHNGLTQLQIGVEEPARQFLAVADAWAAGGPP